jgi:endonuclease-3
VTRRERALALCDAFARVYPDAHCELDFRTPLELLIATILSAQCTDKRVNMVTPALFARCPSARHYAEIDPAELEKIIQSTGFFRSKAKNIRACCADLVEKHAGEVPREMDALTALAGVGRKTANVVLGNAFGIDEGVVVDTHVQRLSNRLGLTKEEDPVKIEQDLIKLIPRPQWTLFSHWLIWHGRRRCTARSPDCAGCEVQPLCPCAFKVPGSTQLGEPAAKPKPPKKPVRPKRAS